MVVNKGISKRSKTIDAKLKRIISSIYFKGKNGKKMEIKDEYSLADDIGFHSAEIMALIAGIEDIFGINIPDRYLRAEMFETVYTIKMFVSEIINKGKMNANR
jgi:acyl carrier protein